MIVDKHTKAHMPGGDAGMVMGVYTATEAAWFDVPSCPQNMETDMKTGMDAYNTPNYIAAITKERDSLRKRVAQLAKELAKTQRDVQTLQDAIQKEHNNG